MNYADAVCESSPSNVLRLTRNETLVRVTVAYYDEFDDTLDKETLIGDFKLADLRRALNVLETPTSSIPVIKPSRSGRRKPRGWWSR